MTEEQYKKYKKINNEIEEIINFLIYVGIKRKDRLCFNLNFGLCPKKFDLRLLTYLGSKADCTYEIPYELQKRIVKTIEQYVDEKQKELEEI